MKAEGSKMANKFTQSILERQELLEKHRKPTGRAPEIASADAEPPAEKTSNLRLDAASAEKTEPEVSALNEQPETLAVPKKKSGGGKVKAEPKPVDLSAYLVPETPRLAKNKTFYLDTAVIEAVHEAATEQKITDSKLVNDILRKVLGLPRQV